MSLLEALANWRGLPVAAPAAPPAVEEAEWPRAAPGLVLVEVATRNACLVEGPGPNDVYTRGRGYYLPPAKAEALIATGRFRRVAP